MSFRSLFVTLTLGLILAAPALAADDAGTTVLDENAFWRWTMSWRKPAVPADAMKAAGKDAVEALLPVDKTPFSSRPDIQSLETAPAPQNWMQPDFDASDWSRDQLRVFAGPGVQAGQVCLRGLFEVADPAAVRDLQLSLKYRGGVVVYVNGKEIARGDMPEGPITGRTPANRYPDEAWVDSKGAMLPKPGAIAARVKAGETDLTDRVAKRDRALDVAIPADALRKGVNVLAIALHRSDYHPVALNWFNQQNIHSLWIPIRLAGLKLTAAAGVTPNNRRPAGVRAFNLDIHNRIDQSFYGDALEPLHPVRITGAVNGVFGGSFAISSDKPLKNVTVKAGELASDNGGPAVKVQPLYMLLTTGAVRHGSSRRSLSFDALSSQPVEQSPLAPDKGSTQPLYLRVDVPADAKPGDYKGNVTVVADGVGPITVPVELHVADYRLPGPQGFRTHAGLYQSPTSLSMQYEVEEWSEEHWKLMDQAFALLARAGNDLVNIPVVEQTQFGNDLGMVYWVRNADGSFSYDFTVFDRYVELARKHLGSPRFVALQIWHSGGWGARPADQQNTVTVIDPKTRKRVESLQVPAFGTEESKKFWTPVLHQIRDRLAKVGLDRSIHIGILSDGTAPPEVFKMFAEILPDANWTRGCHSVTRDRKPYAIGAGRVGYHEFCYGMSIPNPDAKRFAIYDQDVPGTAYFRSDFDDTPPMGFHLTAERALYQGTRGFGRNCMDYWDFTDSRKRLSNIYNRYPFSSCAQREPTTSYLSYAGPDGPISTIRYELLLLGLQDAEAVVLIAEASDKQADQLGAELVARCKQMWADRINAARVVNGYDGEMTLDYSGWRKSAAELYKLAGEVQAKLQAK